MMGLAELIARVREDLAAGAPVLLSIGTSFAIAVVPLVSEDQETVGNPSEAAWRSKNGVSELTIEPKAFVDTCYRVVHVGRLHLSVDILDEEDGEERCTVLLQLRPGDEGYPAL